jgi:hypothetical protein
MPKAMQKTLLKLGILGFASLILFNFPLLSLYRGQIGAWPWLYLLLFALWLLIIFLAQRVVEPDVQLIGRPSDRDSA